MALRAGATAGNRPKALRRLPMAALVLSALLLATSCSLLNGSGDSSGGKGSSDLEHPDLKVATAGLIDTAAFQVALTKGYFKQEGLHVIPTEVSSGTESVPKVASNALDIGFSNWATVLAAENQKVGDFRIVAAGARTAPDTMDITTYPGSGIHSLKDLPGKTVSTNSLDDVPLIALKALMAAHHLDYNKIHIVVVHHPDAPQALAKHTIQAAIQLEPYKAQSASQIGARPVVDLFAPGGPTADLPLDGYFTTAKFAQQNPKTVAAFARAMQRGAAAAADRNFVEKLLPTYTKIDARTATQVSLPAFPTSVDAQRLQRVADLMKQFGVLDHAMDVKPLVVLTPQKS